MAIDTGTTRYEIPNPITVPDKSATMVLLLSHHVPGEAVFLFAPDGGVPDSSSHPFRVARFTNDTKGLLERGPIAVFEKGSFLGQGMVDPLPPGATATVPFALERSLAVEGDRKFDQAGARLHQHRVGRADDRARSGHAYHLQDQERQRRQGTRAGQASAYPRRAAATTRRRAPRTTPAPAAR